MRTATLTRIETSDEGTFGTLTSDSGFACATGELPWRNNLPNISCIPSGTYTCVYRESPRHGFCYHVENVPGRSAIEIHPANLMGDESQGFDCDLEGCISPGTCRGTLQNTSGRQQKAVLYSVAATTGLEQHFNQKPFELTILDDYPTEG